MYSKKKRLTCFLDIFFMINIGEFKKILIIIIRRRIRIRIRIRMMIMIMIMLIIIIIIIINTLCYSDRLTGAGE